MRRGLFLYSLGLALAGLVLVGVGLSQGQIVQSGAFSFLSAGGVASAGAFAPLSLLVSTPTAVGLPLTVRKSADGAQGSGVGLIKSRGTEAAPTIVQSGDVIGSVTFAGYDGAAYIGAVQLQAGVDATPGTNDMPGVLNVLTTPDGSATAALRLQIKNTGAVLILDLKTTGAATGKKVVCVDTATGQLYASSTGTDCSN